MCGYQAYSNASSESPVKQRAHEIVEKNQTMQGGGGGGEGASVDVSAALVSDRSSAGESKYSDGDGYHRVSNQESWVPRRPQGR